MKRFKEYLEESYKEIEFLCHNQAVKDSTPLKKLKALKKDLKNNHHSVITLHQNWTKEYGPKRQHSLTAIYSKPEHRKEILHTAKKHGVKVDLEQDVTDEYAERAINGKHDNQVKE